MNQPNLPGIKFKNPKLLITALTHRSALNEKKGSKHSYERLEFLGDAVIELSVSNHLYLKHPHKPEGDLTQYRASIVQTKTLAAAARKLELGQKMYVSLGEKRSGGQKNISLLADCFEAVIGAIYLDQGFKTADKFISTHLLTNLKELLSQIQITDYKSQLQEICQKKYQVTPIYKIIKTSGPEHKKTFKVKVYLNKTVKGQGSGKSKLASQQKAAKAALEKIT